MDLIDQYLQKRFKSYEIIIIDDGSLDNTPSILTELVGRYRCFRIIRNKTNTGKGYAVRMGVLASEGEMVLICDADLSVPIEEIEKLQIWIYKGFDIVIGSRALRDSEIIVKQPSYRELMGRIFNIFVRLLVLKEFKDTQCGFKLLRGEVARDIFKRCLIVGFSFDVEVLYIAKKVNYKIKEVPIRWSDKEGSKLNVITDPLKMLIELFKIRWIHR